MKISMRADLAQHRACGDDDRRSAFRSHPAEDSIYTDAVRLILSGRYRIEGRRVIALPNQS